MPLREQHMSHPVIARVDREAPHPADLAIDGKDTVTGSHLGLTHRDIVFADRPLVFRMGPTAQPDFTGCVVYQVNGDKSPGFPPVSRLDDKVGDRSVAGSMIRRRTSPPEPSEQLALAPIVNSASEATAASPSGAAVGCCLHHARGPNAHRSHASGESAAIHACLPSVASPSAAASGLYANPFRH
jgi:hypothetical protein